MFNVSDGSVVQRKILEDEYTMLATLQWIYFKQVKNLKELEQIKNK